jgi:hypothetical protein
MKEQIKIHMISPKKMDVLIPQELFDEFEQAVKKEDLNTVFTEAISEELKKIRFRSALRKAVKRRIPHTF